MFFIWLALVAHFCLTEAIQILIRLRVSPQLTSEFVKATSHAIIDGMEVIVKVAVRLRAVLNTRTALGFDRVFLRALVAMLAAASFTGET